MATPREAPNDIAWATHVKQLEAYKAGSGHANAPQRYRDPDSGFFLGGWLSKQREAHRGGTLPTHRHLELRQLGVEFDIDIVTRLGQASPNRGLTYEEHRSQTWRRALKAAEAFVASGGDLNEVRRNIGVPDAPRLGRWIYKARADMGAGELPEGVAAEWERLGLRWTSGRLGKTQRRG